MNSKETIYPLKSINKNYIDGYFQVLKDGVWMRPFYLKNKDVLKICSYFYFNYGTTYLTNEFNDNIKTKLIETIDCWKNATNFQNCKIRKIQHS